MLKKDITFELEDDDEDPPKVETVTRTYRFNLTEIEMMRLDAKYESEGGYFGMLELIGKGKKTHSEILAIFEELVTLSYGIKEDEDFIKSEKLRERFICSPAYNALILEFLQGDSASFLAEFVSRVLPKSLMTPEAVKAMRERAATMDAKDTPALPDAAPKG